jgi:hypothetical protein
MLNPPVTLNPSVILNLFQDCFRIVSVSFSTPTSNQCIKYTEGIRFRIKFGMTTVLLVIANITPSVILNPFCHPELVSGSNPTIVMLNSFQDCFRIVSGLFQDCFRIFSGSFQHPYEQSGHQGYRRN